MHSNSLIVLGVILAVAGFSMPYLGAVLVVDTSPPTIYGSDPSHGQTYSSLPIWRAYVIPSISGIFRVYMTVDSTTMEFKYNQTNTKDPPFEVWQTITPTPTLADGSHTFLLRANSMAGVQATSQGTFKIYTGFNGTWSINGITITSSTQKITTSNPEVAFRFQKTTTTPDSTITCKVMCGGSTYLTLSNTASGVWAGTVTFASGTYNLNLIANDGTQSIIMATVTLDFGSSTISIPSVSDYSTLQLGMMAVGVALVGYGMLKRKQGN